MRNRWGKRVLGGFGCVFVVAFVGLLNSTAGPFRSVSGRGESASEANARLWNCLVPVDATEVWYVSSYRGTRVECTLGPESFESWCRRRGWRLHPIADDTPEFVTSQRDGRHGVERGFQFDEMNGDFGCGGVYDAEHRRAYVFYSGG